MLNEITMVVMKMMTATMVHKLRVQFQAPTVLLIFTKLLDLTTLHYSLV